MTNLKKQKVVTYVRVTSTEQVKEVFSLKVQQEMAKKYAKEHNLEIAGQFSDVGSGSDNSRKGLQEMLQFLDSSKTCKTILVEKPERLSRDADTFNELQAKYTIIAVNSETNDLMNRLEVMFAQHYSELHSERMKEVWKKRKAKEAENNTVTTEGGEEYASI